MDDYIKNLMDDFETKQHIINCLERSGSQTYHLLLVLLGVKPGDIIEWEVPNVKEFISLIEILIEGGAPLDFLNIEEVSRVKTLPFEDFSKICTNYKGEELISYLNSNERPRFGLRYHHTSLCKEILNYMVHEFNIDKNPLGIILDIYHEGLYFGYPICCIKNYLETALNGLEHSGIIMPYTEHRWCSSECIESKNLQKIYKTTIHNYLEGLPELGPCFR